MVLDILPLHCFNLLYVPKRATTAHLSKYRLGRGGEKKKKKTECAKCHGNPLRLRLEACEVKHGALLVLHEGRTS